MEIEKLDHIGIRVMDFLRAIQFYQKFGFQVVREDVNEGVFVIKHPSGVELNLLNSGNDDCENNNILMDYDKRYPGYTHYAMEVPSVIEAKLLLEKLDIEITEGPITFGDGKTSIFIRDPDRNVIEFTQLPANDKKQPESKSGLQREAFK